MSCILYLPRDLTPSKSQPPSGLEKPFVLKCTSGYEDEQIEVVHIKSKLTSRARGKRQVFRASAHFRSSNTTVKIVFKIAYQAHFCDQLKEEADLYQRLDTAANGELDQVIPQFMGLYVGVTDDGPTSVLLMQDCGKRLQVPLVQQPASFRKRAVQALLMLHKHGICHGNFVANHIVVRPCDDGSPWPTIVDLSQAVFHDCPFAKYDGLVKLCAREPESTEDYCDELHYSLREAQVWYPRTIKYFKQKVDFFDARDIEKLIGTGLHPPGTSDEMIQREAMRVNAIVERYMENREEWDANEFRLRF